MPVIIELVAGNLAPSYAIQLKRNGTIIPLGTVLDIKMNIKNAQNDVVTGSLIPCSVSDAVNGIITFTPTAAIFPSASRYVGEVRINHVGSLPEVLDRYVDFVVRDDFI